MHWIDWVIVAIYAGVGVGLIYIIHQIGKGRK